MCVHVCIRVCVCVCVCVCEYVLHSADGACTCIANY